MTLYKGIYSKYFYIYLLVSHKLTEFLYIILPTHYFLMIDNNNNNIVYYFSGA